MVEKFIYNELEERILEQLEVSLVEELISYCDKISKRQIELISKLINRKRRDKYPDSNEVKYEGLEKRWSEEDYKKLIENCDNNILEFAIKCIWNLGVRSSELVELNIKNLDRRNWTFKVTNYKARGRIEQKGIPRSFRGELMKWVYDNEEEIESSGGYVLYSNFYTSIKGHVSKDYLRKKFRELTKKTGIQVVYDESTDGRNLNLVSLHGGRHSFATQFYAKSNFDIEATRRALGHKDIRSTSRYVWRSTSPIFDSM